MGWGEGRREHGKRNRFADDVCGYLGFGTSPGNGCPAGICRWCLLRRNGHYVQARLRGGLHFGAGGGESGVVWLPVLHPRNGRTFAARRPSEPPWGRTGVQAHGAWCPHLHHLDSVLLCHERAACSGGPHTAVSVHLDGTCLADHYDAARAQASSDRLGRAHRVRHRVRERHLQDGTRRLQSCRARLRPRRSGHLFVVRHT